VLEDGHEFARSVWSKKCSSWLIFRIYARTEEGAAENRMERGGGGEGDTGEGRESMCGERGEYGVGDGLGVCGYILLFFSPCVSFCLFVGLSVCRFVCLSVCVPASPDLGRVCRWNTIRREIKCPSTDDWSLTHCAQIIGIFDTLT